MITVHANIDEPKVDYTTIIDKALIKLRKDLRSDLSGIVKVIWNEKEPIPVELEG